MIRDITIGQFFPGDSVIHRLDPRVKIIATLLFIIELFIVDNFLGFAIAALCLGVVINVSKVPLGYIVRGLKPIIIILLLSTLNDYLSVLNLGIIESLTIRYSQLNLLSFVFHNLTGWHTIIKL